MNAKKRIKKILTKGARKVKYRKGFGIHSPFVFSLITQVIDEKLPYYDYRKLKDIRERLTPPRSIKNGRLLKNSVPLKLVYLYYRLVNRFLPNEILELNNDGGIITMALAMPFSKAHVTTLGVDDIKLERVHGIVEQEKQINVTILDDDQNKWLSSLPDNYKADMVVIHKSDNEENYSVILSKISSIVNPNGIIVVAGINSNAYIRKFWTQLTLHEEVKISLDLYELGIAIYHEMLYKQHFIVSF
ncbi:MAG: class I SAM-dependent methyltransferase [Bacteroidales bacterium]|nr:class I SAM-dependent methyltransferase [Bacteroidales bacterium]